MPAAPPDPDTPSSDLAWYVVHTRTKAEHIAAAMLESMFSIPSYCPRIKFQRATSRGKVWFIEALFPSYFFARFDPATSLRAVRHAQSVLNVIEFGGNLCQVPDPIIEAIRSEMDGQIIKEIASPLQAGDLVEITDGPMRGLAGIVHSLRAGEDRVRILLDFLGSQNPIDVPAHTLLSPRTARSVLAQQRKA